MKKTFRIASISSGANSFGLHGHIMVAKDGTAYEVARNRGSSNPGWLKHEDVHIPTDKYGEPMWHMVGCEIPKRLEDPPDGVLTELFGADFQKEFPKSRPIVERAAAGLKKVMAQDGDAVINFIVNRKTWDILFNECPPGWNSEMYSLFTYTVLLDQESKHNLALSVRVVL